MSELGFNYRMDAFQGAVLGIKLKHLEAWTEARRRLADRYREGLARSAAPAARRGHRAGAMSGTSSSSCTPSATAIRRELEARGIPTGLHYPVPVHLQDAYAHLGHQQGDFPIAERVARDCFTLPLFPEMTDEQQDRVIERSTRFYEANDMRVSLGYTLNGATVLVTGGPG